MTSERAGEAVCGRCGKDPAEGFAEINGVRYCHGETEDDRGMTCYEGHGIHNMQMRALAQIEDELMSAEYVDTADGRIELQ